MAEEKQSVTKEESAEMWKKMVRENINNCLDRFLDLSMTGNIGIRYANPVLEVHENGDAILNEKKSNGVEIRIVFQFENEIDMPIG